MTEWLIERGIGEERALLVDGEQVMAAKLYWPGEAFAGQVVLAKLVSRLAGSARGIAQTAAGTQILLNHLPRDVSDGSSIEVALTRPPMAERGRLKLAQGRVTDGKIQGKSSPFEGLDATQVRRFPAGLWEEVWDTAWNAEVAFAGGSLLFDVTPAMTVIDIDGELPPRQLAEAAIPAIAQSSRWLDLGGSIGIDFPTIAEKAGRRAVDEVLGAALANWPHERTAMNGFGFVQLVARSDGPSLLHRMAMSRVGAAARAVLRRAELLEGAGMIHLTVHPAVNAKLKREWLDKLARRSGRLVDVETDPGIALGADHAQLVSL